MKTPAEVRTTAARRFRASCRRWLAGHLGLPDDSAWPFAVPLGVPSEREVLADPQKTLDWRDAWSAEAESGRLKVAFAVRDWTACGRQTVPERAVFESPEAVARAAGELHTWRRALERASRLVDGEDGLREAVVHAWSVLAEWEDEDFAILLSAFRWLADNPESGLYVRQLPVEGMDTKWLTKPRMTVLRDLLAARWRASGRPVPEAQAFEAFAGLRSRPSSVRMRLLDPADRADSPTSQRRRRKSRSCRFIRESSSFPKTSSRALRSATCRAPSSFSVWARASRSSMPFPGFMRGRSSTGAMPTRGAFRFSRL